MAAIETIEEFYRSKSLEVPTIKTDHGHFNVFSVDYKDGKRKHVKYARMEYYKISLLRGHFVYHYADKSLEVDGTTLLFFNPDVPYTFEQKGKAISSYFCIFKKEF